MDSILVIDVGTSSMRGTLFSILGKELYSYRVTYTIQTIDNVHVEQDPLVFRKSLLKIVKACINNSAENNRKIKAISVSSQRSSVTCVDKKGKPLRNFIMWHDKRTNAICNEINSQNDIYSICGMKATPVYSAPKMVWIKQNEPDIYEKTYKFVGIHEYIIFLLTGRFLTDTSIASRTCLLDIAQLNWSDKLIGIFGINKDKLCDIAPVGAVCGKTSLTFTKHHSLFESIPVITAGGDQQCAILGLNVIHEGQAVVNCGTGGFVICVSDKPVFDVNKQVVCNVFSIKNKWILEVAALSSGMVYDWFNKGFYPHPSDYKQIDEEVRDTDAGAGGLIMMPDLLGKGAPYFDNDARGAFYNIGINTKRNHFARAVLESIAAQLGDCLGILKELLGEVSEVTCAGGLTKSDIFNQIQADHYNVEVIAKGIVEATSIGAWAIAVVTLEIYSNLESALKVIDYGITKTYKPIAENHDKYERINMARHLLYHSIDSKKLQELLCKL